MLILALLTLFLMQTKHLIVDWVWQPPYEHQNKGTYGHWGGIQHAGKNAIGTGLCLLVLVSPIVALHLAMVDFLVHYHIDWTKVNLNRTFALNPQNAVFWWLTGFDQYLHQVTYLALVGFVLT
ncbi:MAG: DUF3307 domain-containing protein [Oxalobacteraceae bacterium]|nr:MAG: DUF3307 domain-containing protein [Oxalobacteraceae bacterium]